jgi:alcohol dehydrogenase (cytochrome c)
MLDFCVGKTITFCPSLWGGKDWPSASYTPPTGMLYIPANDNLCGTMVGEKKPLVEGQLWLGGTSDRYFRAFDAKSGKLLWQQKTNSRIMGNPVAYEVDGVQYIRVNRVGASTASVSGIRSPRSIRASSRMSRRVAWSGSLH